MRRTWPRRPGCGCSSTLTGSSTRLGWVPGWRRPRGTSACAAWRRTSGWCSARTISSSTVAAVHEPEVDERLLADERAQVVRDALSRLPRRWQRLLEMLMADPPVPYAEISDRARAAGRQHRPHPRTVPGPAARPAAGVVSQVPRHRPTGRLRPRPREMPSGPRPAGPGRTAAPQSGRRAASSAGPATGMSVPGIRRPCLAGEASITAGSSVAIHVAPGTAAPRPGMRRRSRAPSGRPTAPPPASHAGP